MIGFLVKLIIGPKPKEVLEALKSYRKHVETVKTLQHALEETLVQSAQAKTDEQQRVLKLAELTEQVDAVKRSFTSRAACEESIAAIKDSLGDMQLTGKKLNTHNAEWEQLVAHALPRYNSEAVEHQLISNLAQSRSQRITNMLKVNDTLHKVSEDALFEHRARLLDASDCFKAARFEKESKKSNLFESLAHVDKSKIGSVKEVEGALYAKRCNIESIKGPIEAHQNNMAKIAAAVAQLNDVQTLTLELSNSGLAIDEQKVAVQALANLQRLGLKPRTIDYRLAEVNTRLAQQWQNKTVKLHTCLDSFINILQKPPFNRRDYLLSLLLRIDQIQQNQRQYKQSLFNSPGIYSMIIGADTVEEVKAQQILNETSRIDTADAIATSRDNHGRMMAASAHLQSLTVILQGVDKCEQVKSTEAQVNAEVHQRQSSLGQPIELGSTAEREINTLIELKNTRTGALLETSQLCGDILVDAPFTERNDLLALQSHIRANQSAVTAKENQLKALAGGIDLNALQSVDEIALQLGHSVDILAQRRSDAQATEHCHAMTVSCRAFVKDCLTLDLAVSQSGEASKRYLFQAHYLENTIHKLDAPLLVVERIELLSGGYVDKLAYTISDFQITRQLVLDIMVGMPFALRRQLLKLGEKVQTFRDRVAQKTVGLQAELGSVEPELILSSEQVRRDQNDCKHRLDKEAALLLHHEQHQFNIQQAIGLLVERVRAGVSRRELNGAIQCWSKEKQAGEDYCLQFVEHDLVWMVEQYEAQCLSDKLTRDSKRLVIISLLERFFAEPVFELRRLLLTTLGHSEAECNSLKSRRQTLSRTNRDRPVPTDKRSVGIESELERVKQKLYKVRNCFNNLEQFVPHLQDFVGQLKTSVLKNKKLTKEIAKLNKDCSAMHKVKRQASDHKKEFDTEYVINKTHAQWLAMKLENQQSRLKTTQVLDKSIGHPIFTDTQKLVELSELIRKVRHQITEQITAKNEPLIASSVDQKKGEKSLQIALGDNLEAQHQRRIQQIKQQCNQQEIVDKRSSISVLSTESKRSSELQQNELDEFMRGKHQLAIDIAKQETEIEHLKLGRGPIEEFLALLRHTVQNVPDKVESQQIREGEYLQKRQDCTVQLASMLNNLADRKQVVKSSCREFARLGVTKQGSAGFSSRLYLSAVKVDYLTPRVFLKYSFVLAAFVTELAFSYLAIKQYFPDSSWFFDPGYYANLDDGIKQWMNIIMHLLLVAIPLIYCISKLRQYWHDKLYSGIVQSNSIAAKTVSLWRRCALPLSILMILAFLRVYSWVEQGLVTFDSKSWVKFFVLSFLSVGIGVVLPLLATKSIAGVGFDNRRQYAIDKMLQWAQKPFRSQAPLSASPKQSQPLVLKQTVEEQNSDTDIESSVDMKKVGYWSRNRDVMVIALTCILMAVGFGFRMYLR